MGKVINGNKQNVYNKMKGVECAKCMRCNLTMV